jgi:hypothetical protein
MRYQHISSLLGRTLPTELYNLLMGEVTEKMYLIVIKKVRDFDFKRR